MKRAFLIGLGLTCACLAHSQSSGQLSVARSVVAGGGAMVSSGSRFQLSSTLGQPVASVLGDNRFSIRQGFWIWRAPVIFAASSVGTDFVFSVQSEPGKTYSVQYSDSLSNPNWQSLSVITGDGSVLTVTNSAPTATLRYYRLIEQ